MNCTLKSKTTVPPDGFRYMQPETGVTRDGQSLSGTITMVIEHRKSNHLERQSPEEVAEDVERQICQRVPPNFCNDPDCSVVREDRITKDYLVAGTLALLEWIKASATGKTPFVEQTEANRRAAICARCFLNSGKTEKCSGCKAGERLREAMGVTIGERTTDRDGVLDACRVCGCLNRVTVWFSAEILRGNMTDAMREKYRQVPGCWKALV